MIASYITPLFSVDQMIQALENVGYTVKFEEEEFQIQRTYSKEGSTFWVYNVYWGKEKIQETDGLQGTERLKFVFQRELEKKLLELFKPLSK